MNTAINLLSVIPMRKEASHRSEMVSQLLFGEYVEILEEEKDFTRVKCLYDNYEGWVQANQLTPANGEVNTTSKFVGRYNCKVVYKEQTIQAPFGAPVYPEKTFAGVNAVKYQLHDEEIWNSNENFFTEENLRYVYHFYLNTPYLWGGKSVFGIDCSGFVQQVFKLFGVALLRDAYLQAEQGNEVKTLSEAQLGDLAFFQNEKGRVVHVGIILKDHHIVHASGRVRIDTIDAEGILNSETGRRTHQLHSIRRYVS